MYVVVAVKVCLAVVTESRRKERTMTLFKYLIVNGDLWRYIMVQYTIKVLGCPPYSPDLAIPITICFHRSTSIG